MNQELSRRHLLKGAATLMTLPALAPFASTPAMAATAGTASPMAKYPRSGVFGSIAKEPFRCQRELSLAGHVRGLV